MQNNQPFAMSLPLLQPMESMESYLGYVSSHYEEYNQKMADVKAGSYKDSALDLRKIGEKMKTMGQGINNLHFTGMILQLQWEIWLILTWVIKLGI